MKVRTIMIAAVAMALTAGGAHAGGKSYGGAKQIAHASAKSTAIQKAKGKLAINANVALAAAQNNAPCKCVKKQVAKSNATAHSVQAAKGKLAVNVSGAVALSQNNAFGGYNGFPTAR